MSASVYARCLSQLVLEERLGPDSVSGAEVRQWLHKLNLLYRDVLRTHPAQSLGRPKAFQDRKPALQMIATVRQFMLCKILTNVSRIGLDVWYIACRLPSLSPAKVTSRQHQRDSTRKNLPCNTIPLPVSSCQCGRSW